MNLSSSFVFFLHSNNVNPVNTNSPGNVLGSFSSIGSDDCVTWMSKDGVELTIEFVSAK